MADVIQIPLDARFLSRELSSRWRIRTGERRLPLPHKALDVAVASLVDDEAILITNFRERHPIGFPKLTSGNWQVAFHDVVELPDGDYQHEGMRASFGCVWSGGDVQLTSSILGGAYKSPSSIVGTHADVFEAAFDAARGALLGKMPAIYRTEIM